MLLGSKFHIWDRVLRRLTGKYQFGKMSGESHTGTNLLPDLYVFVRIRFQISRFLFSEKYANFIHKQGATDYNARG